MYINEHGETIDIFKTERAEQLAAERYIQPDSVVLELGARYGTVSCTISCILNDSRNLVAVEPDPRVWAALEHNRAIANADFHIVKGVISKVPVEIVNEDSFDGYGLQTVIAEKPTTVECFTLDEIKRKYNLKFNTLVADCEGSLGRFLEENPEIYDEVNLFLFEQDVPTVCDYEAIKAELASRGFEQLEDACHQAWKRKN